MPTALIVVLVLVMSEEPALGHANCTMLTNVGTQTVGHANRTNSVSISIVIRD